MKNPRPNLRPDEYQVMANGGTEAPFSGALNFEFRDGQYYCTNCGVRLFTSQAKFESGCGWPSFATPSEESSIRLLLDESHGMVRTEVRCAQCDAHLGHVFDDGPKEQGGLRYCINSLSLQFTPDTPARRSKI